MMAMLCVINAAAIERTNNIGFGSFYLWDTNNSTWDISSLTLTPNKAWGGGQIWLGSFDASDYQQVILKLSEPCTQAVALTVQYTDFKEGSTTEYQHTQAVIEAGKTEAIVTLEKKNIQSIMIQLDSETYTGVEIKLSELYFYYKDDKVEIKKNLSNEEIDLGNWANYKQLDAKLFNEAHAGDKVVVSVTKLDSSAGYGQVFFQNGKWLNISSDDKVSSITIDKNSAMPTTATLVLTDDILQTIRGQKEDVPAGLIVKGCYLTIKDIDLISEIEKNAPHELTVEGSGYASLCLPFEAVVPSNVTVYTAKNVNENKMYMAAHGSGSIIPINTPMIVKASAGTYSFEENSTGNSPVAIENNLLSGTLTSTPVSNYVGQTVYALTKDTENNKVVFGKVNTVNIPANKAFYVVDTTNQSEAAKSISIDFDGETTMVEGIVDGTEADNGTYHNIGGQRVVNPRKGLYIKNNKKVVINK